MRVRAFAKINLSLRVVGRRDDGYHDLRTVFQSIALYDTLTIRRTRAPFRLTCDDPQLPVDRTNLIWRAADAMWKAAGNSGAARGIAIGLAKRIPIAAGLGGGSSDAAATLRALAALWRVDEAKVRRAAARLGADVPYFLEGGTVVGEGRGDVLRPKKDHPKAWVVLVVPPFGVSTAEAYRWFDRESNVASAFRRTTRGPAKAGHYVQADRGNDLQRVVATRHPEIVQIVTALRRSGASHAAMSGSGSAVFGLFHTRRLAAAASTRLSAFARTLDATLIVTRTLSRAECRRLAAN